MKLDPRLLSALLDALRAEHASGDPNALLRALSLCLDQRCALPEWAAEALLRALAKWHSGRAPTLDEALGFKVATPKRTVAAKRERLQALQVLNAMHRDRLAYPDAPINADTFDRIGAECRMSAATAKRRYYAATKDATLMRTSPSARTLDAALLGALTVPATEAKPRSKARRAAR